VSTSKEQPILCSFASTDQAVQAVGSLRDAGVPVAKVAVMLPNDNNASDLLDARVDNLGVHDDLAVWCRQELRHGHTVVVVSPNDQRDDCAAILQRFGGLNAPESTDANNQTSTSDTQPVDRLETREERIVGERTRVDAGDVVIRKVVDHIPVTTELNSESDVIEVERVPIDQVVPQRRDPWQENDALIVPIYEERLVVERQIVLKEQLRVTRSSRTIGHQVSGTIRRERIVVEDPGNAVREVPPESISASDTTSPMPDSGNSYKPN
jgi:uncharacterized protein (TIGR02271 family)